jgi:hypothetical protein
VEGPASFDVKYLDVPSSRISFATATEPPTDPDPVPVDVDVDENVNVAEADEAIPEPPSDKPAGPSGKLNFNPEPSPSVKVLLIPLISCLLYPPSAVLDLFFLAVRLSSSMIQWCISWSVLGRRLCFAINLQASSVWRTILGPTLMRERARVWSIGRFRAGPLRSQ